MNCFTLSSKMISFRQIGLVKIRQRSCSKPAIAGIGSGEAILILHCIVERDRIKYIQQALEKMNGILSVDLLESRTCNMGKL
jgi:hypothetical protein